MSTSAICLDQNQNSISCSDPNCTYGDCGSTSTQVTSGALCLDSDQNAVACTDPECTYGDCSTPASAAGAAAASTQNGGSSLATSKSGSGSNASLLSSIASLGQTVTTAVAGPPKTTLTLGASGLSVSSLGGLFSNPLMILMLAVIAFLLFGMFRKKSS